ncbi:L-xylulose reductase-like [Argiope bruennichi]|uniref:L-xylulose reductase-like n=1 Tax=Argiope bruennichi TaxID=94029 RepID=UPI0024943E69|nr:L-xylulose reductase-like [Argiope bruennichi]
MEKKFTGKRALVTGAGRGIGKAIVLELVKHGAHVIALSHTKSNLEKLKEEAPGIEIVSVDVRNWKETENAVKKLGHIDLLVNNAGVLSLQPVGSITEEEVDNCFAVNVKAVINISQIVAKGMVERKTGGAIVNISSQAAIIGLPNHTTYCASKGAVDQVTKVMALELGPHKVRVNSINPTIVRTDMGATAIRSYGEGKEVEEALKAKIPLGKFCEVNDVVKATMFLLSDEDAGMITGAQLPLEGGYIIQ